MISSDTVKTGSAATLTYELNGDLTGWTILFVAMLEPGGVPGISKPATITSASPDGTHVQVDLTSADTAVGGHYLVEFHTDNGGETFIYPDDGYTTLDILPFAITDPQTVPSWDSVGDIVDEIIANILGPDVGNVATLDLAVDADGLVLKLDDVSGVSKCAVEVDHELMLVATVDPGASTARIRANGRGYRGTTAVSHEVGSLVTIAPTVARSAVLREMNNELSELYPSVMAVEIEENVVTGTVVPLDSDVGAILDVTAKVDDTWTPVRRWSAWASAPEDIAPSGYAVSVPDLDAGTLVRITLGKRPTPVTSTKGSFTHTGLGASVKPLVVAGTVLRLLPAFDAYRLSQARVGDNGQAQVGPASILARELKTRKAELIAQQQRALRTLYPARIHFV